MTHRTYTGNMAVTCNLICARDSNNNNNTLLKVQYPRSSVDYTNYSKEKY